MSDVQRVLFMALECAADRDFDRFLLCYQGDARLYIERAAARTGGTQ